MDDLETHTDIPSVWSTGK